ncbi:MAG: hypothetical protein PF541_08865 [Prolixibacteraceae bacterium]|jgi:alginate O-acetyltransferase complex protein AlgI|nr:hypothetical protein [Prolixibacteraceae bacterium]
MIFNSVTFVLFFGLFLLIYWLLGTRKLSWQNYILLGGSYLFYAWTDWRFLFLLIAISIFNFFLGIQLEKTTHETKRRLLLWLGLVQGIGGLFLFKYFNFFIASFNDAFSAIGFNVNLQTLKLIIPLGISYFTFKTLSYLFDVDKGKVEASKNWLVFFNYVSFFPTILSGPIDKGRTFIPQIETKRVFNNRLAVNGLKQFFWGLFKKMVIADNLALITDPIFENYAQLPSSSLLLGAFFFAIQLYADFSGYSDMAIGTGQLLGFRVTKNFESPFFAQNIAEFWRKWHMSLTSWFTEYVFTPLSISFRDFGKFGLILAILINFFIIGLWHGASWTFALFGLVHGILFIPLILTGKMNKKKRIAKEKLFPTFKEIANMLFTFTMVALSFVIFRVEKIKDAFHYFIGIFSSSSYESTLFEKRFLEGEAYVTVFILLFLLVLEWKGRKDNYALENRGRKLPRYVRFLLYAFILFLIGMFAPTNETPFMYLKF